jgi:hypothetical protein
MKSAAESHCGAMPDQEEIKPIYDLAFMKQQYAPRETAFAVVC